MTLKKSRGVSIAFLISQASSSPTSTRPTTERGDGRFRRRTAESPEGRSVRASTAIRRIVWRSGRTFQFLPDLSVALALSSRVDEIRLRARREQGLQVIPLSDVDRELERGARRTGQVAVLVQREATDQPVRDVRLEDVVDHARPCAVRLLDGVQQHLRGLGP